MCMQLCVFPCKCMTCVSGWLGRPGEDIRCLGAEVTGNCKPPNMGAGTKFGSFRNAASSLNCLAISPAPIWIFCDHCMNIVTTISYFRDFFIHCPFWLKCSVLSSQPSWVSIPCHHLQDDISDLHTYSICTYAWHQIHPTLLLAPFSQLHLLLLCDLSTRACIPRSMHLCNFTHLNIHST